MRVKAEYINYKKGPKKAEHAFKKAIEVLENSPCKWETGVAYYQAASALPRLRNEYLAKAREIFEKYNIKAELRRMDRLAPSR